MAPPGVVNEILHDRRLYFCCALLVSFRQNNENSQPFSQRLRRLARKMERRKCQSNRWRTRGRTSTNRWNTVECFWTRALHSTPALSRLDGGPRALTPASCGRARRIKPISEIHSRLSARVGRARILSFARCAVRILHRTNSISTECWINGAVVQTKSNKKMTRLKNAVNGLLMTVCTYSILFSVIVTISLVAADRILCRLRSYSPCVSLSIEIIHIT
jgi:hypothetical protein